MSDDLPDEGPKDPAEPEPEPVEPAPRPLPVARPGASPATQVATAAVVVVVLLVLGVVILLQGGQDDAPRQQPTTAVTTVPDAPSSGFRPSANSSLAAPPLDIPASLCPSLTLQHPFTVLSFNIHSAMRKSGGLAVGQVSEEIASWKPDIVLLQEVDTRRPRSGNVIQAQQIGEALDMGWVAGSGQTGNALLSRFPIEKHGIVALPQADGKFDRHAVHAVVDIEGTSVSVYSTHFDHMSQNARVAQARALAKVMAADPLPKIVGGDLNSRPTSLAVAALRSVGLGDVWAVGVGSGFTAPVGNPRIRIDYVLHDAFFQPLQSVVLRGTVSDHRAVWSRLQLSEQLTGCIKVGG